MAEKKDFADVIYEHRKVFIVVTALVILAIIGFGVFSHMRTKKAELASFYFSKGLKALLQAEAKNDRKTIEKAIKWFDKAALVGVGEEAKLAILLKGRALFELGKEGEAERFIVMGLKKIGDKSLFYPVFLCPSRSSSLMKTYITKSSPFLEVYVRYCYALALISEGKRQEAVAELNLIKGKFPNSPFAADASKLLEVIR